MTGERQRVSSGSPYEPQIGFTRALRAGSRVLVSGTGPIWPDDSCPDDAEAQARRALEIIVAALAEAGASPEHVVRTRMYLTEARDWEAVARAHAAVFAAHPPAATMVVVAALLDPRWRVEIEAEAELPGPRERTARPLPGLRALIRMDDGAVGTARVDGHVQRLGHQRGGG